ncbi:MAG: LysR family transcriptional regulator [Legionellaceae bacterium]|nr:LysR family transcriptional regulator [Legionellaceae bacterium]
MSLLSPQLQAFMAIVRHKTVHAAAESIALTQTAVTQRIRALERSLRTTLFIRTRRGMLLTAEGEALQRYCQSAKALEGEALAQIQGAASQSEVQITISAPTSLMSSRVVPDCLPIMRDFPHLLIHFDVNDLNVRHQDLKAAKCDFALLPEEHLASEMRHKPLRPEEYVLIGPKAWEKRSMEDIVKHERIIDFDPSDVISFNYLKQYGLFDLAQHGRHFVNRTENVAFLISEGIGYSTLTKEFAEPYVKQGQLAVLNDGKTCDVKSVLAWYDRPEPPAYFKAIIDAID